MVVGVFLNLFYPINLFQERIKNLSFSSYPEKFGISPTGSDLTDLISIFDFKESKGRSIQFESLPNIIGKDNFSSLSKTVFSTYGSYFNEIINNFPLTSEVIWQVRRRGLLPKIFFLDESSDKAYADSIKDAFSRQFALNPNPDYKFKHRIFDSVCGLPVYSLSWVKEGKDINYNDIWDLRENSVPRTDFSCSAA